jgi:aspartyl-tRNA(Asn)/glutamyl-tRNA(Gln) amidotransferase subunit B
MSNNKVWEVVIGIETHAQLKTNSKIFSSASTQFGARPNSNSNFLDAALPGTLPVLNMQAVELAIKFGLAINAQIDEYNIFARKNYFYPDLPKGYQISQFAHPIVGRGQITIPTKNGEKTIRITRAHLEEDAGKSLHKEFAEHTGIDLNRAGTPLLEIVTEPDISSSDEAVAYAKTLHRLVTWIDICDGNMQEGSFRCDANVSVRIKGDDKLGTRCEIKNLNSFVFLKEAIDHEVQRQISLIEDGGKIVQETRLYDPNKKETRSMRSKEDAQDYRYFPDPDLLPIYITQDMKNAQAEHMPELPQSMKLRIIKDYELSDYDASFIVQDKATAMYFLQGIELKANPKLLVNWLMGDVYSSINEFKIELKSCPISPKILSELIKKVEDGIISNKIAKEIFAMLWQDNTQNIDSIIDAKGLRQVSDEGAILAIIDEILANNHSMVVEYKGGKEKSFNALIGQIMKASKGKANPSQVNFLLKQRLEKYNV